MEGVGDGANRVWLAPDTPFIGGTRVLTGPSSASALDTSRLALSAKGFLQSVIDSFVVVIFATVRVQYQGRASSIAAPSPRLIITKPDGTLIIHEDTKQRPLNWQPPGTKFQLSIGRDSKLVLKAFRTKHREKVTLWFDRIQYIAASRVVQGTFRFTGSESEMVDVILENPGLIEPGFVPERREHRTRSGTLDLVGRDREGNLLVLEFKRRQAQLSSASQLHRYVEHLAEVEALADGGMMGNASGRRHDPNVEKASLARARETKTVGSRVRGGIVAPSITGEALALLKKKGYQFFKLEPRVEIMHEKAATSVVATEKTQTDTRAPPHPQQLESRDPL